MVRRLKWLLCAALVGCETPPLPVGEPILASSPSPRTLHEYVIASEARRVNLDTALAIAISRWENPDSDPMVWSYNGCCLGLMQVNLSYWEKRFVDHCGAKDLYDPRTNACYGVRIFLWHLSEVSGDTLRALAAYSGYARNYVQRVLEKRAGL